MMNSSQSNSNALWAVILGVLNFFLGFFAGVPAMIIGIMEIQSIDRGTSPRESRPLAILGFVMGLISTALTLWFFWIFLSAFQNIFSIIFTSLVNTSSI